MMDDTIVATSQNNSTFGSLLSKISNKSKTFAIMYNEHTMVSVIKIASILTSASNLQASMLSFFKMYIIC